MENISLNIAFAEAVKSAEAVRLGIKNDPGTAALENMKRIAGRIFEPVRHAVCGDMPLAVTSFFRSPELNAAIAGSSSTSQHCFGEAMDLDADVNGNGTNAAIFEYISDFLPFDQLIWEFGDDKRPAWVHVSLCATGNRHQRLRSYKQNGKTVYKLL